MTVFDLHLKRKCEAHETLENALTASLTNLEVVQTKSLFPKNNLKGMFTARRNIFQQYFILIHNLKIINLKRKKQYLYVWRC